MSDRVKVDVEIWEFATPIEDVNWSAAGTIQQKAIISTAEASSCAVLLSVDEDGVIQASVIPTNFKL